MNTTLYKYRSNLERAFEIIDKKQLHCANWYEMNDPMEGIFFYNPDFKDTPYIHAVSDEKKKYKICSLSRECDNLMMWSSYSDAFKGICISIDVSNLHTYDTTPPQPPFDLSSFTREMSYQDRLKENLNICNEAQAASILFLSRKLKLWEYEKEVRVFSKDQKCKIKNINEVIIGFMNIENYDGTKKDTLNPDVEKIINTCNTLGIPIKVANVNSLGKVTIADYIP